VRAEILAGFVNGLFLVFIAFFILSEAMEVSMNARQGHCSIEFRVFCFLSAFQRVFEPPEIHHERLLVISVLGFIVNLIGIFVFQHGGDMHHGHSHGGQDKNDFIVTHSNSNHHHHGHSHEHDDHGHSHDHGHNDGPSAQSSSTTDQIFQGVFLHILADTLGSVGVIISSLLIRFFDWHIADPICSIIIALLISLRFIFGLLFLGAYTQADDTQTV
jgi:zinc transporter 5/7